MLIVIDVKAHYDWEPYSGTPSEEDVMALRMKPTQDGKWLKKVVKDRATYTEINLPESEIADCMAHFERTGQPKSRAKVVAWYLSEKVMPHHSHEDHWTKIKVHDEPEIEEYLNRIFDLNKKPEPVAAVVVEPAPQVEEKKTLTQRILGK